MPTPPDKCPSFPCRCIRNADTFGKTVDELTAPSDWQKHVPLEDIRRLVFTEYLRLRCLAANSSSPRWRAHAVALLAHQIFRKYWEMYP